MRRLLGPCIAVCLLAPGAPLAAADADTPVALPPFLVEEAAKGPPWRYGQAAGYEILSRCDDATTRRVVAVHHRLQEMLAAILPVSLQVTWSQPRALILYDEELQPKASQEVIARLLRPAAEVPVIEPDLGGGRGLAGLRVAPVPPRIRFLPNLRLWDSDGMTVFMIVRRDGFDPDRLALTHDYVAFLVRSRVPALPVWFVTGFLSLYRELRYDGGELRAEGFTWVSEQQTDAWKRDPRTAAPVVPLADFFRGAMPPAENAAYSQFKHWQAQAALLVRWGLDTRDRRRAAGFVRFVERAAADGVTEALFEECLGLSWAEAHAQLTAFLGAAVRRGQVFRPERLGKLPAFTLANATDAQLARIKGDWERLEVAHVRTIAADLEQKYLEQARRTLRRGYERDPVDPALLAVLGLCEIDGGNPAGAREFLESAFRLGPVRPRAAYELARLRFAESRAAPAGTNGRLDATQLADVLRPLFSARQAQPPLAEVYALIAEGWEASATPPTRGHLAVLDEGVQLFPRQLPLVLRAVELNRRHGFKAEAARIAAFAAELAVDATARDRLLALRDELVR